MGVHPHRPPDLQSRSVWQPPQRPLRHLPQPQMRSSLAWHGNPTNAGISPGLMAVGLGSGAGGGSEGHCPGGHVPGWQGGGGGATSASRRSWQPGTTHNPRVAERSKVATMRRAFARTIGVTLPPAARRRTISRDEGVPGADKVTA